MLILIAILFGSMLSNAKNENLFFGILVPIIMLLFTFALEHFGYALGKSGIKEVLGFLEKRLLAYPTTLSDKHIQ